MVSIKSRQATRGVRRVQICTRVLACLLDFCLSPAVWFRLVGQWAVLLIGLCPVCSSPVCVWAVCFGSAVLGLRPWF